MNKETEYKHFTEQDVEQYIINSPYYSELLKKKAKQLNETQEYLLKQASRELVALNNAILAGHQIRALLEKYPRNLDSGKHWFQIEYPIMNEDKTLSITKFWALLFMDKNNDRSCFGWGFSSSAIGMSRMLDATDHVFNIIGRLGGKYIQL